ncbi:MAG: hypothetical protein VB089_03785 [Anaerolineaceae bacterium]|nr:hypothetical protein [Anaerolineaceae bacterium]
MPVERQLAYKLYTDKVHRFFVTGGWEPNAPEVFFGSDASSSQTAWKDAVNALLNGNFHWAMGVAPQRPSFEQETVALWSNQAPELTEELVQTGAVVFLGSYRGNFKGVHTSTHDGLMIEENASMLLGIRLGRKNFITPIEALQQIETHVGLEIPPEVCYAFLMAWYAIASPKNKAFFDSDLYRSVVSQAVSSGCSAISRLFPYRSSQKTSEDPWQNGMIKSAADHLISLSDRYLSDPHSFPVINMVSSDKMLDAIQRPSDIARIVMETGRKFVRSGNWLSSPEARRIAENGSPSSFYPWAAIAAAESVIGMPPRLDLGYGDIAFGNTGLLPSNPLNKIYSSGPFEDDDELEAIYHSLKNEIASEITRSKFLPQAIELKVGGIPTEAAKALIGNRARINSVFDIGVDLNLSDDTKIILKTVADHFRKEAEKDPQYAPYGCFRVPYPPSLDRVLSEKGVFRTDGNEATWMSHLLVAQLLKHPASEFIPKGYDIFAYPDCLWVRSFNSAGESGYVFQWRPDHPLRGLLFAENHKILTDAILSGIWHDLRVSGGEAFLSKRPAKPKLSPGRTSNSKRHRHSNRKNVRIFPRIRGRLLELDGDLEWGSESDRETIQRQIHGVSGHIRLLPQSWKPSQSAKANAAEYGVVLPENSQLTFVRPHIRGRASEENGLKPQSIIKAKALATLSALEL